MAAEVHPQVLQAQDRAVLHFERAWANRSGQPGAKDAAVHQQFRESITRYTQRLNVLLDNPAAVEHDPVLVNRLRRIRDARTRGACGLHP